MEDLPVPHYQYNNCNLLCSFQVNPSDPNGGINVNACDGENNTALHLAVERGHDKWVEYLLTNKVLFNFFVTSCDYFVQFINAV